MTRLLCVGDLHLGKGGGYGRTPGERLAEQEQVWERALEIGRDHEVDAILFAGDAFEGPLPTPEHYAAFARPLARLECPLIAITGNGRHDSALRDTTAPAVIQHPDFQVHSRPAVVRIPGPPQRETVTVACLPWAPVSRLVAAEDGGDRDEINRLAADLLIEAARGLRAQVDGHCVLLTHFSISGAVTPDGADVGLFREPVLPLADLQALGFDAIVAGHIHRPQHLAIFDNVAGPIFYVGSPMPLDFGEGKCEHGVWILDIDKEWATSLIPIESRRFLTIDYDATDPDNPGVLEEILHGDFSMSDQVPDAYVKLRYTITAEHARVIDGSALREALFEAGAYNVWVEPTIVREARVRVEGLDDTISDQDMLARWVDANVEGDETRKREVLEVGAGYLEEIAS